MSKIHCQIQSDHLYIVSLTIAPSIERAVCRHAAAGTEDKDKRCVCVICTCLFSFVIIIVVLHTPLSLSLSFFHRHDVAAHPSNQPARRDYIDRSEVIVESLDSLMMHEHFSSLEDTCSAPQEILSQEPTHIIRLHSPNIDLVASSR